MEYTQDLIYLTARIQPEKAASEIKEHFRTGLDDAIQIGMAEHPEWDDLALFEYIKCADRQQQVETAKAHVRKRVGQRGTGRILALSGTPRRGDARKLAHFTMAHTTAMPSKGTKEWRDWCRRNAACFGCGSIDHQFRSCTKSAPTTRKGPPYRGRGGFGARQPQQGKEVRKFQPQWKTKGKPESSGKLRAIAGPYNGQGELQDSDQFDQLRKVEQVYTLKTYLQDAAACQLRGIASTTQTSVPVRVLVDSGATEQYLSTDIVRKL